MSLPNPDDYNDWREYARALVYALGGGGGDIVSGSNAGATPPSIPGFNALPDGYVPVWLDEASTEMYLGNSAFDPPDAPDLFQIDTTNLAAAAVTFANMAPDSVGTANIINANILSAKIADAAIISALIGDAQIVSAKISALAVNESKIADAAITSAKIANLAVGAAHIQAASIGTAHIQDGSIVNAKIGNVIQSADWDEGTKQGWKIDKAGNIQGRKLVLYDDTGTAIFEAGGTLDFARIFGAGYLASLDEITAAELVAGIFSAANISTYVQSGAIGTALIADAAIVSALIANAAIGTAHIQDAAITSAKITSLVVDKITSGTLDAEIEVGDGIFAFEVGASVLFLGNGFGDSDQFFLWFGPSSFTTSTADEAGAIVYLKTDGSAYFGGSFSAGIIRNAFRTLDDLTLESSVFTSLAGTREYVVSYSSVHHMHRETPGALTGTTEADVDLYVSVDGGSYALVESMNFGGSSVLGANDVTDTIGGSFTYTDTSGGTSVQLKVEVNRSLRSWPGSPPDLGDYDELTQSTSVVSTEE